MPECVQEYENYYGSVVLLKQSNGFTVKYEIKKVPGIYRVRIMDSMKYDDAVRQFNRYRGALKRRASIDCDGRVRE